MKVLQINDNIAVNSGVTSTMLGWFENIDKQKITFDFLASCKRENQYEDEIKKAGGKVFYMQESEELAHPFKIMLNAARFMKEHASEYDAVHLHSPTFAFPYLYFAKKYNVKVRIVHAHALTSGGTFLKRIRNFFMLIPIKHLANGFIACSKGAGEYYFEKRGIRQYLLLENGINRKKYRFDADARRLLRDEMGLANAKAVVHVSNMSSIKNVPFVIEVFNKILKSDPKCKLVLIGRAKLPEDTEKAIEKYGIGDKVINLGVRSDIPQLLSAMDICLLPSHSEGFGLLAVECQASGLPVIISEGFQKEVAVSDCVKVLPLKANKWAQEALGFNSSDRTKVSGVEGFDIKAVTKKLTEYYLKNR